MSRKNQDNKNRFRSQIISFRASPEEWKLIDSYAKMSGLNKQDYMLNRVMQKDIIVRPSTRIYKALLDEMQNVQTELKKIETQEFFKDKDEFIELIAQIDITLNGLGGDVLA